MKLKKLLHGLEKYKLYGENSVDINEIVDDSRKVKKGILFVAITGVRHDGHDYIADAIQNGAVAVVGERPFSEVEKELGKVTYVKVKDSRRALSQLAQAYYNYPAKKMKLIGVTGTDGKTTTVSMIYYILSRSGKKVGMINTVEAKLGRSSVPTGFHVTNPQPLALQKLLKNFADKGAKIAVVEVTSHSLSQERVYGVKFDISALTNISAEHLDYHKSMSEYAKTKTKLFSNSRISILNKDDKFYPKFKSGLKGKQFSYGINTKSQYQGKILEDSFVIINQGKEFWQQLDLGPKYNYYNALAAIAVVNQFGVSVEESLLALKNFKFPKGRLQKISNNKGIDIIIDYAHTPNAVGLILGSLKKKGIGLFVVVSAEGERDPRKREKIAYLGSKYADYVILNPIDVRSEPAADIGKEMINGAAKTGLKNWKLVLDRGGAIYQIIKKAKKGDKVVILGKGHETGMELADGEYEWSDFEAVKLALKGKKYEIKHKIKS